MGGARAPLAAAEAVLLGGWMGVTAFMVPVAVTAFAVLPTRDLAGNLVGRTLDHANLAGVVLGLIILAIEWARRPEKPAPAWAPPARMALVILMTAASAISREVVSPKLLAMRRAMGDIIDHIARDDPRRVAFDTFHHVSVGLMLLNLGAGLAVALLLMAERRQEAGRA